MNIDLSLITSRASFRKFLGVDSDERINFELLGHGEYNLNYIFKHPQTKAKLVLRIPMGSQMHIKKQVSYEYKALKLLENSGRTPKPLYMDDTIDDLPYGFLVMEFLPGESLPYQRFLLDAANCLADIHNVYLPADHHLIVPKNPLKAILDECLVMVQFYLDSDVAVNEVKNLISALLEKGSILLNDFKNTGISSIINTELNSGNFLNTDKTTYLVDWEKPIFAHIGQDLGHFLAPTTTLWKTDTILSMEEIHQFLRTYCKSSIKYSDALNLWKDTKPYFMMNCLRGITWCAMAYVEYQSPDRALKDEFTYKKIKFYLTTDFLNKINEDYFGG